MRIAVKGFVKASPVYPLLSHFRAARQINKWRRSGCPTPPPSVYKQRVVATFARKFGIKTLIETGTLFGEMVAASRNVFQYIYSIELDETLFQKAEQRFDKFAHIKIIKGDSGDVLPSLLRVIDSPCLFWLDGHYSGEGTGRGVKDTPVSRELEAILRHARRKHVVLVDDARLFDGENDYPTINAITQMIATHRPEWALEIAHDIIRIFPLLRSEDRITAQLLSPMADDSVSVGRGIQLADPNES